MIKAIVHIKIAILAYWLWVSINIKKAVSIEIGRSANKLLPVIPAYKFHKIKAIT
jgi:hypothetical protein